jgi:hypothetical protein
VPKLFGVTLFISATLLFLVQPMVGKMILPLLGGTPAVWNTCMVFYQALLLAGYFYAHKTTTHFPTQRQVAVHTGLLLVAVGTLALGAAFVENHSPVPVVKSLAPQGSEMPFFGVIALLAAAIGVPFFTVSATAPLLQKWFSETGHSSAKDPYFLYAASNAGSLLGLMAYPFVVEPNLRLVEQAWMWAGGFVGMLVLIVLCGKAVLSAPPPRAPDPRVKRSTTSVPDDPMPNWTTRLRWLLLAAVPSSLMLAVTTDVTTDMVSMPLLWIVPLSLYLITFIIVFAKSTPAWVHLSATLITPVLILLVVFMKTAEPKGSIDFTNSPKLIHYLIYILPFATFFMVALTCHGELVRTRPSSKYLTSFYLTMSLGGMIGGLFNALFAPMVFKFVSEYPFSLVAACFLIPPLSSLSLGKDDNEPRPWTVWDLIVPLLFFAAARLLSWQFENIVDQCDQLIRATGVVLQSKIAATILAFGLPTLACYFLVERPRRFGAAVGAIWLGAFLTTFLEDRKRVEEDRTVYKRSFFGTMKVEKDKFKTHLMPRYTRLIHGTTVHGSQQIEPDDESMKQALWLLGANNPVDAMGLAWISDPHLRFPYREPLSYYHRTGPVGAMFWAFWERNRQNLGRTEDVACIGLGTGSLSAYGLPGRKMTFFEIDWTVRELVEKPRYFTYLDRAINQGVDIEFIMGDARLSLEQTERKWGFMLVDAFSSDSIPTHLLTKQAVELYFDRLDDDGLLALHISNRYLRLEPVVEHIVRELKLEAFVMSDRLESDLYFGKWETSGKLPSSWVVVAKRKEALKEFLDDPRWKALEQDKKVGLWTDDYTPIKSVLQGDWDIFGK